MLRKLALGCGLVAVATVPPAHALPAPPPCCACAPQTSDTLAFFCVSPSSEAEEMAAQERCSDTFHGNFLCLFPAQETSEVTEACVQLLRQTSMITCPTRPGAPVLGGTALAGLVTVLGVIGALTLRRRASLRG